MGNAERGKKLASSRALSSGLHLHHHGIRPQVEQTRISSHELLDEEDEAAGARLGDLDGDLSRSRLGDLDGVLLLFLRWLLRHALRWLLQPGRTRNAEVAASAAQYSEHFSQPLGHGHVVSC